MPTVKKQNYTDRSCKFTEKNYLYSIVLTLYIRLHHVRPAFLHHHSPATLLLLGLLTSCRHPNKSSDIQAHETLVHVQALLQSDSFPENDSLLTPSIRFFTQHGPDSLLAQAYYLQGEILRHHHFMLRASDAYIKALELCPDSSQLRFRIHLAQAKTCRIEKIASEAAHHLNLAGRLLPALRHQGCRTDFLHEKAMLCLLRQDTNAATRYFKAVTDASAQAEYPTERRHGQRRNHGGLLRQEDDNGKITPSSSPKKCGFSAAILINTKR